MNFYGRKEQLKILQEMFGRREMQTALIYGRRRAGKTALVRQAIKDADTDWIYYKCRETSDSHNACSFSAVISERLHCPKLAFDSMEEALDFVFRKSQERNLILVIDEYAFLRNAVPGCDSILKALIDKYRETSGLKLVILNSQTDIKKFLPEPQNPLYGHFDRMINLKPMDYHEAALFYGNASSEDKVRLYSVFGGIPGYNTFIDPELSVSDNIIALLSYAGARLKTEVFLYLKAEFSKPANALQILDALSQGAQRFSEIQTSSLVGRSATLADLLDKLIRMELVTRDTPINDPDNSRKARYQIADPFFLFYFRYCFHHASQLAMLDPRTFFSRYIADDFENWYAPRAFADICKQYLRRQNRSGRTDGKIPGGKIPEKFDNIGRYWHDCIKFNGSEHVYHRDREFEIVTRDPRGYIFYEAAFRKEPITEDMIAQEIEQFRVIIPGCYRYGFISRSGFLAAPAADRIFISLDELYEE